MPQWMRILTLKDKATPRSIRSLECRHRWVSVRGLRLGNPFSNQPGHYVHTAKRSQIEIWKRNLSFSSVSTFLVPPVVFIGLGLTLWTYKCIMMVLFQNKIIYMPSIPPFSRSEKIRDYAVACSPVVWEERKIKSLDGTQIALCIGSDPSLHTTYAPSKHVAILYFQGNGSSLPPRLPGLSQVLLALSKDTGQDELAVSYSIVALSYRGYWTSKGKPSQKGIEMDAQATLSWTSKEFFPPGSECSVILWGQSIGAAVATTLAATHFARCLRLGRVKPNSIVSGLVLETPFVSIRSMLATLYPQRWLPYRYLWPFLWSFWDSEKALRAIAETGVRLPMLIVQAGQDEVVPEEQTDRLERLCSELDLKMSRKSVKGAFHTETLAKGQGRMMIGNFLKDPY